MPKSPTHFRQFFVKESKIIHFTREILLGQLLQTFGNFLLVTLVCILISIYISLSLLVLDAAGDTYFPVVSFVAFHRVHFYCRKIYLVVNLSNDFGVSCENVKLKLLYIGDSKIAGGQSIQVTFSAQHKTMAASSKRTWSGLVFCHDPSLKVSPVGGT